MYSLDRSWVFPSVDGGEFSGIHANLSIANDKAKIFHGGGVERTFGEFDGETVFTKSLQNATYSFMM